MARAIKKKFVQSTVKSARISMVDGNPHVEMLEPVVFYHDISEKEAKRKLNEVFHWTPFQILDIEKKEVTYEMSVETFVEHAVLVAEDFTKDAYNPANNENKEVNGTGGNE